MPATAYFLGGFSVGMFQAIKLIVRQGRLIRDMRGLHAKLPPPAMLMSIVGASMHRLCYRIVLEYYPLIRIIYGNQSSIACRVYL